MTAAEKRGSARKNLFKCLAARLRIDSKKIVPFQHKKKKKKSSRALRSKFNRPQQIPEKLREKN